MVSNEKLPSPIIAWIPLAVLFFGGARIPIGGGGYFRMFPWRAFSWLVNRYCDISQCYTFYIHPFEWSSSPAPTWPQGTRAYNKWRFSVGRSAVPQKTRLLIELLSARGARFLKYADALGHASPS